MYFEILSMRKSNNILRFGSRESTWRQGVNCACKPNTETKGISLHLAWAQLSSVADIFCKVAWPHSNWTLKWEFSSNWLRNFTWTVNAVSLAFEILTVSSDVHVPQSELYCIDFREDCCRLSYRKDKACQPYSAQIQFWTEQPTQV